MTTVAGTGHRPDKLGGYGEPAYQHLLSISRQWLREHPEVEHVISGMALGFDQALADAAIQEHRLLTAAVPFQGQELRWPSAAQLRYHHLLAAATDVVVVCQGSYHSAKMQQRNRWMVDHADLILTMWDGSPGGTSNCLDYARARGKPIHNLLEAMHESPSSIT